MKFNPNFGLKLDKLGLKFKKKNPLKNLGALVRLNPYALTLRRLDVMRQARQEEINKKRKAAQDKGQKIPLNKFQQVEFKIEKKN